MTTIKEYVAKLPPRPCAKPGCGAMAHSIGLLCGRHGMDEKRTGHYLVDHVPPRKEWLVEERVLCGVFEKATSKADGGRGEASHPALLVLRRHILAARHQFPLLDHILKHGVTPNEIAAAGCAATLWLGRQRDIPFDRKYPEWVTAYAISKLAPRPHKVRPDGSKFYKPLPIGQTRKLGEFLRPLLIPVAARVWASVERVSPQSDAEALSQPWDVQSF